MRLKELIAATMIALLVSVNANSQTTGKISGQVKEKETGLALPGVNVTIEGTHQGAATDAEGRFFIINIPPGVYTVTARMIGYQIVKMEKIRVSVNSTTSLAFELTTQAIEGEEVVVTAQAISVKKDQTSSVRTVSTEDIDVLPIENMNEVVNLQAGVVQGHFRGGRDTEVSYMIDGMPVNNSFSGNEKSNEVDVEVIQELEVITGTFNAEYGQAMSGVVNAVTKDGSDHLQGSFYGSYANYLTANDDIFIGLNQKQSFSRNANQDYKVQMDGPILKNRLYFLVNYRYQNNQGYLNGLRRFTPNDYSEYIGTDPYAWHTENSGDEAFVAMDTERFHNLFSKLTWRAAQNIKLNAIYSFNDRTATFYEHAWKYNPDPQKNHFNRSSMGAVTLNHLITPKIFYDIKLSYNHQQLQSYLYENPLDERYLSPYYNGRGESGFITGGDTGVGRPTDTFSNVNLKLDAYWQATTYHALKTGFAVTAHAIDRDRIDVRNKYEGTAEETQQIIDPITGKIDYPFYELEIIPKTDETLDIYTVNPFEVSSYLQDKMEFDNLVINLGLRYDYFNPDQIYPTNRRNPGNQLSLPDSMMSTYPKAAAQNQLSPRFGLAYQLGEAAVLRFSYGHFFQMPPMFAIYQNNVFRVPTNDYGITMGNAQLEAQKTVTYEIGLWQQLLKGMSLEMALYYKDIYNLLSTMIVSTYNQIEYGLFTNKDYGNARGLEVKFNYQLSDFYIGLNYTLSYTKGNADNPWQTFTRAGSSRDPIRRYIPMSWDQRHTLNVTAGYSTSKLGATVTGYYNSGTPYTYTPLGYSELSLINLYENNDIKPGTINLDLKGYWRIALIKNYDLRLVVNIYNVLDALNARWVYGDTGKPYEKIVSDIEKANYKSDYTDVYDQYKNPSAYASPRMIKCGLQLYF